MDVKNICRKFVEDSSVRLFGGEDNKKTAFAAVVGVALIAGAAFFINVQVETKPSGPITSAALDMGKLETDSMDSVVVQMTDLARIGVAVCFKEKDEAVENRAIKHFFSVTIAACPPTEQNTHFLTGVRKETIFRLIGAGLDAHAKNLIIIAEVMEKETKLAL